jgi:hypothetical protein
MPYITVWALRDFNEKNATESSLLGDEIFNIEIADDIDVKGSADFNLTEDFNRAQRVAWMEQCGGATSKVYAESATKAYAYIIEVDDTTLQKIKAQIKNSQQVTKKADFYKYNIWNTFNFSKSKTYQVSLKGLDYNPVCVLNATTNGPKNDSVENKRLFWSPTLTQEQQKTYNQLAYNAINHGTGEKYKDINLEYSLIEKNGRLVTNVPPVEDDITPGPYHVVGAAKGGNLNEQKYFRAQNNYYINNPQAAKGAQAQNNSSSVRDKQHSLHKSTAVSANPVSNPVNSIRATPDAAPNAPLMGDAGKYIIATPAPGSPDYQKMVVKAASYLEYVSKNISTCPEEILNRLPKVSKYGKGDIAFTHTVSSDPEKRSVIANGDVIFWLVETDVKYGNTKTVLNRQKLTLSKAEIASYAREFDKISAQTLSSTQSTVGQSSYNNISKVLTASPSVPFPHDVNNNIQSSHSMNAQTSNTKGVSSGSNNGYTNFPRQQTTANHAQATLATAASADYRKMVENAINYLEQVRQTASTYPQEILNRMPSVEKWRTKQYPHTISLDPKERTIFEDGSVTFNLKLIDEVALYATSKMLSTKPTLTLTQEEIAFYARAYENINKVANTPASAPLNVSNYVQPSRPMNTSTPNAQGVSLGYNPEVLEEQSSANNKVAELAAKLLKIAGWYLNKRKGYENKEGSGWHKEIRNLELEVLRIYDGYLSANEANKPKFLKALRETAYNTAADIQRRFGGVNSRVAHTLYDLSEGLPKAERAELFFNGQTNVPSSIYQFKTQDHALMVKLYYLEEIKLIINSYDYNESERKEIHPLLEAIDLIEVDNIKGSLREHMVNEIKNTLLSRSNSLVPTRGALGEMIKELTVFLDKTSHQLHESNEVIKNAGTYSKKKLLVQEQTKDHLRAYDELKDEERSRAADEVNQNASSLPGLRK